ncbi:MAG: hypothetical protein JNL56_03790 [Alphaproteobacteria bacterium]|nr:hypothetical protein [Alphaproteobacteria bacterium]
MRPLRLSLALACAALAAGLASATIFRLDPAPPRVSPKVAALTPDEMFSICGFERQAAPFFTDREYRNAIRDYGLQMHRLDPASPEAQRLAGLQEGLKECRENDRNKRYAEEAKRSCKALVKAHKAASQRAWAADEAGVAFKSEIMSWGERFREPLEKCLKSMRCRLDNKQDMAEALAVYREVVDEMSGWILDVKGVEKMKICGVTIRDLRRWCTVEQSTSGNTTTSTDICTDAKTMRDTINLLQGLKPRSFPSPAPGGSVSGGGGR